MSSVYFLVYKGTCLHRSGTGGVPSRPTFKVYLFSYHICRRDWPCCSIYINQTILLYLAIGWQIHISKPHIRFLQKPFWLFFPTFFSVQSYTLFFENTTRTLSEKKFCCKWGPIFCWYVASAPANACQYNIKNNHRHLEPQFKPVSGKNKHLTQAVTQWNYFTAVSQLPVLALSLNSWLISDIFVPINNVKYKKW